MIRVYVMHPYIFLLFFQITQSLRRRSSCSSHSAASKSTSDSEGGDVICTSRSYYKQETMPGILIKLPSSSSSSTTTGFAIVLVLLSVSTCVVLGGYPPSSYYPVKKYPYLPAPPGETPTCAKHGSTFCEKIETYPTYVHIMNIKYILIANYKNNQIKISNNKTTFHVTNENIYVCIIPNDNTS